METEKNEIRFECPKCRRPMVADELILNEQVACPDCGHQFVPQPPPGPGERLARETNDLLHQSELRKRQKALNRRGSGYTTVAILISAVGGLLFVGAGLGYVSSNFEKVDWTLLLAGSAFIGLAFPFAVLAQLFHIRASLEKL